jgi:hypothetical protein
MESEAVWILASKIGDKKCLQNLFWNTGQRGPMKNKIRNIYVLTKHNLLQLALEEPVVGYSYEEDLWDT